MINNISISNRLRVGFGSLLALTVAIGGFALHDFSLTTEMLKKDMKNSVDNLSNIKLLERTTIISGYTGLAAVSVDTQKDIEYFRQMVVNNRKMIEEAESHFKKYLLQSNINPEERALVVGIMDLRVKLTNVLDRALTEEGRGNRDIAKNMAENEMMPIWGEFRKEMMKVVKYYDENINEVSETIVADTEFSKKLLWIFLTMAVMFGLFISWMLSHSIVGPINNVVKISEEIANGIFRKSNQSSFDKDETGQLMRSMKAMNENLSEIIHNVRENAEQVFNASKEMSARNSELSSRTEQQASALEETAATIEQLSSAINQNAMNSNEAAQLANSLNGEAHKGAEMVNEVVQKMQEIKHSSDKISQITAVIDGIAFQTNILALNAAVEAARAGEHGRGFAVVASEVRTLSQKSAQAAKEIKGLIEESSKNVDSGNKFALDVEDKIKGISSGFQTVTELIGQINVSTQEQNHGVRQIQEAVSHIDHATQQNAALVEESAAVAENLSVQGKDLTDSVNKFKLM